MLSFFSLPVMAGETGGATTTFYQAITSALSQLLTWLGTVITSLLGSGELSPLLPLFAVTVAISLVMLTVRIARTFAWGA